MRICIVGDSEDLGAVYLAWLARRRDVEVLWLAEDQFGVQWTFEMEGSASDHITLDGVSYSLSSIDGAIVRLNPIPKVPASFGLDTDLEPFYALERRYGLHWLLDNAPFPVINRPCAGRSNSSKPYQMITLSWAGFQVPRWVATNDSAGAALFLDSCRDGAIYKACSGLRSHVRKADEPLLRRLQEGTAPVILQEYIAGVDVRVHVAGDATFGTACESGVVDYRFDSTTTRYHSISVPKELSGACVRHAATEGLILAGFDFRLTAAGSWFCLEMNPVPSFLPYEAGSGQRIGDAILEVFGTLPPAPGDATSPLYDLAPTSDAVLL